MGKNKNLATKQACDNPSDSENSELKGGMQIGIISERTGLSIRTIRYYDEEALITSVDRTSGGFRLYTEADLAKLQLIKQMKPLGFTIDEMRDVLNVLDQIADNPQQNKQDLAKQLQDFIRMAEDRRDRLREQLAEAHRFTVTLRQKLKEEPS